MSKVEQILRKKLLQLKIKAEDYQLMQIVKDKVQNEFQQQVSDQALLI